MKDIYQREVKIGDLVYVGTVYGGVRLAVISGVENDVPKVKYFDELGLTEEFTFGETHRHYTISKIYRIPEYIWELAKNG